MTSDARKTKAQLIEELERLRGRGGNDSFRRLFDLSPLPCMSVDGLSRLLSVNRAWLEMLGYREDEVLGRRIGEFMAPESLARHREVFPRFLAQGEIRNLEYTLLRKDGAEVVVSLDSRLERIGDEVRSHTILHDITRRRRDEERLAASEERFRGLFESSADGIVYLSPPDTIKDANPAFCSIVGRSRDELIGMNAHQLSPAPYGEKVRNVFWNDVVGKDCCGEYEKEYIHADGHLVPASVRIWAIRGERGAPLGAWAIVRDLTSQRAAARSQELYRLLAENTGDVIWTLDNELRFTYVSPSIYDLRGYRPEEVLGKSVLATVTPESRERIERSYWKLVADEARGAEAEPQLSEVELRRKDGTPLWAEVVVRILRNARGERVGFMGATRDISERKRMEIQVRDSERSLRALFEASDDAMGLLSREGRLLTLNQNMAALLRVERGKAVGRPVAEHLSGEMGRSWPDALERTVTAGMPTSFQAACRGRVLDAALYPVPDEQGVVAKVALYVKDVTERIQAEQALEQRAAQYRRIVETVNEGIMGLDAGRRVTYVNKRTAEFLGRSLDEMLGSPIARFLLPDEREAQEARFLASGEGGPDRFECRFLRQDGEVVWGLVSAAPLREESGEFIGVFTMIADITESKRAEERLRESEARYRNIFENSVEGLYQSTPEGRFVSVNPALARILGYDSPGEAMADIRDISAQLYADPDARDRMLEALNRDGEIHEYEVLLKRRDGGILWVSENARVVVGEDGLPTLYEGSMVDVSERKRTEEALRLTQFSVDIAPIDIFWVDRGGRFVYVNESACRNLGYTREEMQDLHVYDINVDLDASGWKPYLAQRRIQNTRSFEAMHRRKDGSAFVVGITSHYRRYGGQEFLFAYAYDLTERKKSEEALRRSRELLNEVQLISRTGGWEFDLATNEMHWTDGQYRLHGVEPDGSVLRLRDYLGRFVHPGDRAALAESFSRVIKQKAPVEIEYRPRTSGGEERILVGKAIPDRDERDVVWRVYGSIRDVTQERQAARELRQSHERLLTILDAMDADIFVSTLDGEQVLFMNAHMRLAQNAPSEGVSCRELLVDDPDQCRDGRSILLNEAGEPVGTVVNERYHPGAKRWYLDHDRAIRWLEGEMVHLHMGADITELKTMAEELRVAMSEAKAASLAKNEFLANMSHEIRTPLNGLLGMLQILQFSALDAEQRDCLETAVDSGRSLLQILNDILDLSKVESGKLELESQPFELGEVLESVVSVFRHQVEGRGLAISWTIDESLPRHFLADKGRLRQILFNLVGNAAKFTEKGRIEVEAYPLPVEAVDHRSRVFFSVSDTGIGIPDDKLDAVFDPFTQVDGSSTRKYQGTGLGLGIVRRLVTLMGGNVSVVSDMGRGTVVGFTIAAGNAAVDAGSADGDTARVKAGGLSVLVAEDERINRVVVEQLLGRLGHRVVCVENGEQALDALRAGRFDCVLMDIQMPGLDGLATTRAIREELHLALPVIALTAHAMKGDRERFMASGMNGYVSKPFDLTGLESELQRVMAGHQA
ncbi:MAG: PAS domain S-box protein [Pseudodesulfovibrio sp.]